MHISVIKCFIGIVFLQCHISENNSYDGVYRKVFLVYEMDMPTKEINKIHITAWELGLKSLYYQHSMNAAQKFKQKKECVRCEG